MATGTTRDSLSSVSCCMMMRGATPEQKYDWRIASVA
jgi:hypothetical protein